MGHTFWQAHGGLIQEMQTAATTYEIADQHVASFGKIAVELIYLCISICLSVLTFGEARQSGGELIGTDY